MRREWDKSKWLEVRGIQHGKTNKMIAELQSENAKLQSRIDELESEVKDLESCMKQIYQKAFDWMLTARQTAFKDTYSEILFEAGQDIQKFYFEAIGKEKV